MAFKKLTAYAFERRCGIANGYLSKQLKSKGAVGSDILEKIYRQYVDLSLIWLLTGNGSMLVVHGGGEEDRVDKHLIMEENISWEDSTRSEIKSLRRQMTLLEKSNADKDKIISLLEDALQKATAGQ